MSEQLPLHRFKHPTWWTRWNLLGTGIGYAKLGAVHFPSHMSSMSSMSSVCFSDLQCLYVSLGLYDTLGD